MRKRQPQNIAAEIQEKRRQALAAYRQAIKDHVANKPIDLADLISVAPMIGIDPARLGECFAEDVAAYETWLEQSANVELEERIYAEAEANQPTNQEVQQARDKLEELVRRQTAPRWAAESMAYVRGTCQRHRLANPRLFDDLAQNDAAAAEAAMRMPEPSQQLEPVAAAAVDSIAPGAADWLPDDDA